jgi:hypothetical protein
MPCVSARLGVVLITSLLAISCGCAKKQEIRLEPKIFISCISQWDYSHVECKPTKNPDWYECDAVAVKAECVKVKN